MTQLSSVWDGILIGDAVNAPYSATEWARLWNLQRGVGSFFPNYGVLKGTGDGTYDALQVIAKSPASANVEVEIGAALVHGRLYETDAAVTLAVGSNASGNSRIDTVILRADYVAQTVRLVVKQGTPAGSPVRPTLQQDTSIYEIPLADIAVANGFSVINQADITNRQRSAQATPFGWLPFANTLTYLPNGNYDAASEPLGLNQAVAAPVILSANLLLHNLTFRSITSGIVASNIIWAIYAQDVNDGNTGEKALRLVYSSAVGVLNIASGNNNTDLAANPSPVVLGPGLYWVVIKNTTSVTLGIGRVTGSTFSTGNDFQAGNNPTLGQTLDFADAGVWTKQSGSVGLRLNGRVFGQATKY